MATASFNNSQTGVTYQISGLVTTVTKVTLQITDINSTDSGNGTYNATVDVYNQTTVTIAVSSSSDDVFQLVSGRVYLAVATYLDGSTTTALSALTLTHSTPPTKDDITLTATHGDDLINIVVENAQTPVGENVNPADISSFLITIQGYLEEGGTGDYKTWQKVYTATDGELASTNIYCTETNNFMPAMGLQNRNAYEVSVISINSDNLSAITAATASVTPDAIPNTPSIAVATGSSISLPSDNKFDLTVTYSTQIENNADTHFIAKLSQGDDFVYKLVSRSGSEDSTTLTISTSDEFYTNEDGETGATAITVANGTAYTVYAKAVNAYGNSSYSSSESATPSGLINNDQFSVSAAVGEDIGSGVVQFTFTVVNTSGADITGYKVAITGGDEHTFTSDTNIVIGSLTNGTDYEFTCSISNANGYGSADVVNGVPRDAPSAPSFDNDNTLPDNNSVSTVSSGEIQLAATVESTNNGATISSYTFKVTSTSDNTAIGDPQVVTDGSDPIFTGLTNGTAYHAYVMSTNEFSETSDWTQYSGGDGTLVPSAEPIIDFGDNSETFFTGMIKKTYVGNGNFTINLNGVSDYITNNSSYGSTGVRVTATAGSGGDQQNVNVATVNFDGNIEFSGSNALVVSSNSGNNGYIYTIKLTAYNSVYPKGRSGATTNTMGDVHITTHLIDINPIGISGAVTNNSIKFTWGVNDYESLYKYTNPVINDTMKASLRLFVDTPTQNATTNEVDFTGIFNVSDTGEVAISTDLELQKTYTDLYKGSIYKLEVTVKSQEYNVSGASELSTTAKVSGGSTTVSKPEISTVGNILRITSCGSALDNTIMLTPNNDSTSVVSYETELASSTASGNASNGDGSAYVDGGSAQFVEYKDTASNIQTMYSTVTIAGLSDNTSYLIITENGSGATISLTGNPLSLSTTD